MDQNNWIDFHRQSTHMLTDDPNHQRKRKFVEVGDSDAIDEEYNLIFMNGEMF